MTEMIMINNYFCVLHGWFGSLEETGGLSFPSSLSRSRGVSGSPRRFGAGLEDRHAFAHRLEGLEP